MSDILESDWCKKHDKPKKDCDCPKDPSKSGHDDVVDNTGVSSKYDKKKLLIKKKKSSDEHLGLAVHG